MNTSFTTSDCLEIISWYLHHHSNLIIPAVHKMAKKQAFSKYIKLRLKWFCKGITIDKQILKVIHLLLRCPFLLQHNCWLHHQVPRPLHQWLHHQVPCPLLPWVKCCGAKSNVKLALPSACPLSHAHLHCTLEQACCPTHPQGGMAPGPLGWVWCRGN